MNVQSKGFGCHRFFIFTRNGLVRLEPSHLYVLFASRSERTFSEHVQDLLFKKSIEVGLSLFLIVITAVVLRLKQSGNAEKLLASVAVGVGVGFWLHRDLIYLILH
jgi:hypothetical protein